MVARYADYVAMYYIGGCNGLSYTMNYADKKEKLEEEVSEKGAGLYSSPTVGDINFELTERFRAFLCRGSSVCGAKGIVPRCRHDNGLPDNARVFRICI